MLIDFTVANFRSIKDPQTLSLLATSGKEKAGNWTALEREPKIRLLHSAIISGPNASGKSNILKALKTLASFVVNATDLKAGEQIPYYEPFKLEAATAQQPTSFSIEFVLDDVRHEYAVAFDGEAISEESLYFYPKKVRSKLFVRRKGESMEFGNAFTGARRTIESQLLPNVLFLSKAANSNNELAKKVYGYFREGLLFPPPEIGVSPFRKGLVSALAYKKMPELRKGIVHLVSLADPSIIDIVIKKEGYKGISLVDPAENVEEKKIFVNQAAALDVKFMHKNPGKHEEIVEMGVDEESEGTRKIFYFSSMIIGALSSEGPMIIDEFDTSMHPHLTRFILQLFNNPETNPHHAQLIASTHDPSLLDPDLLRRDQIWFTEKNAEGATHLFSLSDFDYKEVRKDTPFHRWYLSGRFGAVPVLQDFSQVIKELVAHAEKAPEEHKENQSADSDPV